MTQSNTSDRLIPTGTGLPRMAVHFIVIRTVHFIPLCPVHFKVIWVVHLDRCYHVIYGVQDLAPKDIQNFNKEISEKAHDNSGNVLTCIIDKMDNINKATILANLIRARIENKISVHEFFRLSVMLERIPYVDLNELGRYQEPYYDNSGDTELLYATGALKLAIIDANDENKYMLSKLGALLLEKVMNYDTIKSSKGGTDIKQLEWEEIS